MTFKFPIASSTWGQEENDALQRVIDSGMFSMGTEVANFEKNFSKYIGSNYAVMVNSGSSANLLMTAALFFTKKNQLSRGDEVIVPAVSWSTTFFPLQQYGLKLRFVDIDINTLNYDLNKLEAAISDRTRLVMVVNLLGNPNDIDAINQIITGKNIRIIEDNCESMGAEISGKMAGTHGIMGSFSCFYSHHICTMEGGLIVTDDVELYHILLTLRAHGWTRNLPKFNEVTGEKSDDAFEESWRFVLPGYNLRPVDMSGAIGTEQLKKLPKILDQRRQNAKVLQQMLQGHPDIMIQKEIGLSSWYGFSLVIRPKSTMTRKSLLTTITNAGFDCRPIVAGNFAKNKVLQYFDFEIDGNLDSADYVDEHGLFIGNHGYDMSDAITTLREIL